MELLVVIGIIGILVAILMPTLGSVNRQAKQIKCMSNLRQIATASLLRAQERGGYLPLAGIIIAPADAGGAYALPRGLQDTQQKKYTYAISPSWGPGRMTIVPYPGAIQPYLNFRKPLSTNDWDVLDKELNDQNGVWKMFQCPATDSFAKGKANPSSGDNTPLDQGVLFAIAFGTGSVGAAWSTNTDYALNEGLLGYHYDQRYKKRYLGGAMSQVRKPAQTVLITDAKVRKDPSFAWFADPWIVWSPQTVFVGPVTLADALLNNGKAKDASSFDQKRHNNRINVAFADTHVDTLRITKGDLEKAYILPPP